MDVVLVAVNGVRVNYTVVSAAKMSQNSIRRDPRAPKLAVLGLLEDSTTPLFPIQEDEAVTGSSWFVVPPDCCDGNASLRCKIGSAIGYTLVNREFVDVVAVELVVSRFLMIVWVHWVAVETCHVRI